MCIAYTVWNVFHSSWATYIVCVCVWCTSSHRCIGGRYICTHMCRLWILCHLQTWSGLQFPPTWWWASVATPDRTAVLQTMYVCMMFQPYKCITVYIIIVYDVHDTPNSPSVDLLSQNRETQLWSQWPTHTPHHPQDARKSWNDN